MGAPLQAMVSLTSTASHWPGRGSHGRRLAIGGLVLIWLATAAAWIWIMALFTSQLRSGSEARLPLIVLLVGSSLLVVFGVGLQGRMALRSFRLAWLNMAGMGGGLATASLYESVVLGNLGWALGWMLLAVFPLGFFAFVFLLVVLPTLVFAKKGEFARDTPSPRTLAWAVVCGAAWLVFGTWVWLRLDVWVARTQGICSFC